MPRPEVLDRIKQAEQEADDIVAEAEGDREQRLEAAREESEEIRERARAEAEDAAEDRLAAAREEIEAEREEILADGAEVRSSLEDRASERTDEVVEFVVDRFEEAVHVQT